MFVEAQAEARDPKTPGTLSFSSLFSQMPPDAFEGAQLPTCKTTWKRDRHTQPTDRHSDTQTFSVWTENGKVPERGVWSVGESGKPSRRGGRHWSWVVKAEQALTTHTSESYTMG